MSIEPAHSWSEALAHFDRLQDLPDDRRELALLELAGRSDELAARVRGLFAAEARAPDDESLADVAQPTAQRAPQIPGYRVLGVLGRGGMGEVYAAERHAADFVQQVALKRMLLGKNASEVHERFLRERRILAQLNHPNIARLLDGGLDDEGNPYFAMERVDGAPITRYAREKDLDLRATIQLFVSVCEAVSYAHRNLIVHRDIKPSNVLVDNEGQVKLLDFGIAKLLDPAHETATMSLAMTPAYAAPEQLLGEAVSTGTDVYSLGLLLYELFTGELPARTWRERLRDAAGDYDTTERPSEEVTKRAAGDPRQLKRLAQQLRGDLDQIVLMALRRDPARRYPTAQALADDLRRYLDGRPVQARVDTFRYRAGKFVRRNALAVVAVVILLGGLIAATAVSIGLANSERKARAQAEVQAQHALRTRDFVVSLFNDINPTEGSGKGKDYSAVQLLQSAAARVDKGLADAPETQAELRSALANGFLQLSEFRIALPIADAAVVQLRDVYGEHSLELVDALVVRAQIHEYLSDINAAQTDAEAALTASAGLPDDRPTQLARIRARTTLSNLAARRNDIQQAIAQFEAILEERAAVLGRDDDPALAVDLNNLASTYLRVERFVDAEAAFRRAAKLFAAANGAEHPRMVWLYNGLAHALLGRNELAAAQIESDRALALALSKLGAEHQVLISIQNCQAVIARKRGDYARAEQAETSALSLAEKFNHPQRAAIEMQYGLLQLDERNYAKAESLFAASIARTRTLVGDKPDSGALLAGVGRGVALAGLGKPDEGQALAAASLRDLQAQFPLEKKRIAEAQELTARMSQ